MERIESSLQHVKKIKKKNHQHPPELVLMFNHLIALTNEPMPCC